MLLLLRLVLLVHLLPLLPGLRQDALGQLRIQVVGGGIIVLELWPGGGTRQRDGRGILGDCYAASEARTAV